VMERKKRFTRSYRESYFVLTPAGFLHEYSSSDPASHAGQTPMFSLFLPACTLGPPSSMSARSHKFHIEGRKDGQGSTKTGSLKGLGSTFSVGQHAWSFRARSHEDMMEWWNDVRMLCARYLVASEQMERSGPVHAAVRSAGYVSEEEEEMESDEGSSVEEEEEEAEDEDEGLYQDAVVDEEGDGPPGYSHPKAGAIEMGPNGYVLEKKGQYETYGDGAGVPISRRTSKRQQEKAPEGRAPHVSGPVAPNGNHNTNTHYPQADHHEVATDADTPQRAGGDAGPAPVEGR